MKKKIFALTIALLMVFSSCIVLSGCNEKVSTAIPTDIMSAIVQKFPEIPAGTLYFNGAEEYGDGYLDPGLAGIMYGDGEEISELSLLESYSIRIASGKSGFEIQILKVKNSSDVAKIQDLLNKRIEKLRASDIVLYDAGSEVILKNAEVYTVGNYVYLISTTDNTIAKDAIKAAM